MKETKTGEKRQEGGEREKERGSFVMSPEALGFPGIFGKRFQSHITTEREKEW